VSRPSSSWRRVLGSTSRLSSSAIIWSRQPRQVALGVQGLRLRPQLEGWAALRRSVRNHRLEPEWMYRRNVALGGRLRQAS
jgi:hypothetical protein